MTLGDFRGRIANEMVTFMIDTGSELILISRDYLEQLLLLLNIDGLCWPLKGPVAMWSLCSADGATSLLFVAVTKLIIRSSSTMEDQANGM